MGSDFFRCFCRGNGQRDLKQGRSRHLFQRVLSALVWMPSKGMALTVTCSSRNSFGYG